jgi:hypothetical protein
MKSRKKLVNLIIILMLVVVCIETNVYAADTDDSVFISALVENK